MIEEIEFKDKVRIFDDRSHAGRLLADKLIDYTNKNAVILAIPAGGAEVGMIIASRLGLPFDFVFTRKLHVPWNKEVGFGAVTWNGRVLLNESLVRSLQLSETEISDVIEEEKKNIESRVRRFKGDKSLIEVVGKKVIVVDDGIASGYSMYSTLIGLREVGAKELIVAVPTASIDAIDLIGPYADLIFCLNVRSSRFFAVADAYKKWHDLSDEDVLKLLNKYKFNNQQIPKK